MIRTITWRISCYPIQLNASDYGEGKSHIWMFLHIYYPFLPPFPWAQETLSFQDCPEEIHTTTCDFAVSVVHLSVSNRRLNKQLMVNRIIHTGWVLLQYSVVPPIQSSYYTPLFSIWILCVAYFHPASPGAKAVFMHALIASISFCNKAKNAKNIKMTSLDHTKSHVAQAQCFFKQRGTFRNS